MEIEEKKITDKEVIILKFPREEFTVHEVRNKFDELKYVFPDKTIIALPQKLTLEAWTVEQLEEMVNNLKDCLDKIKEEK